MVYRIQTGGRKGSRILSNNRAIILHQGGHCRWAGRMKIWLIRAEQPRSKRISCKGQEFLLLRSDVPPSDPPEFTYNAYSVAAGCLCVSCVVPLCGPPLPWWVLCGALPSVWVPCVGPLCGSPLWVPSVRVPCVGPLCRSPVWVSRPVALRHVTSTRVMSPARSHAPALRAPSRGLMRLSDSTSSFVSSN